MRLFIFMVSLFVVIAVLTAGCTQQGSSSPGLPASQISPSVTPDSAISLETYPYPPEDIAVSAQINDKDILDKTVSVFFSGGKGQKMVMSVWGVIQREGGDIERFALSPKTQAEVILQGSGGVDHIRVYAEYFDGQTYQIADKMVRMRQRV